MYDGLGININIWLSLRFRFMAANDNKKYFRLLLNHFFTLIHPVFPFIMFILVKN